MWPVFLCALLLAPPVDSGVLLVRVLDVSDARMGGDAILITDSVGTRARHILIDASDHSATVLARLKEFRVDTLAALILSHPHADHYGGMAGVLAQIPVRNFIYGGTPRTADTYLALLRTVRAKHINVITADTGVRTVKFVTGGSTITMRILAPPPACRRLGTNAGGDAINNCSIGIRMTQGTFAMLFPGDAEESEIGWWMMTRPTLLRADVLKAGHHGSSNATTADLLNVVQPRAVLISANGHQHPFAEVLDMLTARGIPVFCTADRGTLAVRVPHTGAWKITAARAGTCHAGTESPSGSTPP
jgi:competence protein ComEC